MWSRIFRETFRNFARPRFDSLLLAYLLMKFLCRAFCVLFIASCAVRAQETESPLGDFAPLDDDLVLYIPKFSVKLGFRGISGVKTSFGGKGVLSSTSILGDETGTQTRVYHDGYVALDTRTVVDPAGNAVPITPDGKTNSWAIKEDTQAPTEGPYAGLVMMHTYSATTTDASFHEKDPASGYGVELSLDREMGNVFSTKMKWGLVAGMSINQISAATSADLNASVKTVTDYYSLGGQAAPAAPFTGPIYSGSVDITPLLGSDVLHRDPEAFSVGTVSSSWKLRGAYVTFRGGATLLVPFSSRFSALLSAGAVVVYAGSTYDVTQSFKPNTGDTLSEFISDGDSAILPGYFVDASLQYTMNETSGLYLGAVYQSSGDYTQDVTSPDGSSKYTTRIDLSKLQGIRAGVSFKF